MSIEIVISIVAVIVAFSSQYINHKRNVANDVKNEQVRDDNSIVSMLDKSMAMNEKNFSNLEKSLATLQDSVTNVRIEIGKHEERFTTAFKRIEKLEQSVEEIQKQINQK